LFHWRAFLYVGYINAIDSGHSIDRLGYFGVVGHSEWETDFAGAPVALDKHRITVFSASGAEPHMQTRPVEKIAAH
jgi:hypothetical protein